MNLPADDWELCNDDGFVYKRRRKRPRSPAPGPSETDAHQRRAHRRRKTLLKLRAEYRTQIRQWESLSADLYRMKMSRSQPPSHASPPTHLSQIPDQHSPGGLQMMVLDRLVAQAEAQGEMINGVVRLCDAVTGMCQERRRQILQPLHDLPVWGSPRSLLAALTEVDGAEIDVGNG